MINFEKILDSTNDVPKLVDMLLETGMVRVNKTAPKLIALTKSAKRQALLSKIKDALYKSMDTPGRYKR